MNVRARKIASPLPAGKRATHAASMAEVIGAACPSHAAWTPLKMGRTPNDSGGVMGVESSKLLRQRRGLADYL